MQAEHKYLFDLTGFVILRGIFGPDEVASANAIIDKHEDELQERTQLLRNTETGSPLAGDGVSGRKDMGRILEWGKDSSFFRSILNHPALIPYYTGLLGEGYRLDHLPFIISQDKGSEGHALHGGTVDASSGAYNPFLAYSCVGGRLHNQLLAVSVILSDHNAGDGGFVAVPGSHKANFAMPPEMLHDKAFSEFVQQPVTKAGDVVLFSEGTVHGARPWTAEHRRRVALYRFAPATACYSKSYYPQWPAAAREDMTPAQLAVLEPPYALRLERPVPDPAREGETTRMLRPSHKKEFDEKVFGKPSF